MAQADNRKCLTMVVFFAVVFFCLWNNGSVEWGAAAGEMSTARKQRDGQRSHDGKLKHGQETTESESTTGHHGWPLGSSQKRGFLETQKNDDDLASLHDAPSRTDDLRTQTQIVSGPSVVNDMPQRPRKPDLQEETPGTVDQNRAFVLRKTCGRTTGIPEIIANLANKIIGQTEATRLFNNTACSHIGSGWFWHSAMDLVDANEKYPFDRLKAKNRTVAVDLGANIGDTTVFAFNANRRIQLVSLEPSPYTYIYTRWNLMANGIPHLNEEDLGTGKPCVLALWGAATSDGRDITLATSQTHSKDSQMQSTGLAFGHDVPCELTGTCRSQPRKHNMQIDRAFRQQKLKQFATHTVPSYSIPDLLRKHNVDGIAWLKMDCEGCEYETLVPLHESGLIQHYTVMTGEAHHRRIADSSCKQEPRMSEPDCVKAIKHMQRVRELMCKIRFPFASCLRILRCSMFGDICSR